MERNIFNLDQLQVFVAVADEGSFSGAARRLGRAQSAITYATQKLEAQIGSILFNRESYRPKLTDAGHVLLNSARRVLDDAAAFQAQARLITKGDETHLSFAIDSLTLSSPVIELLSKFQSAFPAIELNIQDDPIGSTPQMILEGHADIGLTATATVLEQSNDLIYQIIGEIEFVTVCSPQHPLALLQESRPITIDDTRDHLQLILNERMQRGYMRNHQAISNHSWQLVDVETKRQLLLAGTGWGAMPRHMVSKALLTGRLKALSVGQFGSSDNAPKFVVAAVHRKDRSIGSHLKWLLEHITSLPFGDDQTVALNSDNFDRSP